MTPAPDDDLRPDPALQRMLAHAPDADAQPSPATRAAILAAAHRAVAPAARPAQAAREPWRWLDRWLPRRNSPWNAAFATVLVAFLITLMWQGEPVPEAQPDGPMASSAPPAPSARAPQPAADASSAPVTRPEVLPEPEAAAAAAESAARAPSPSRASQAPATASPERLRRDPGALADAAPPPAALAGGPRERPAPQAEGPSALASAEKRPHPQAELASPPGQAPAVAGRAEAVPGAMQAQRRAAPAPAAAPARAPRAAAANGSWRHWTRARVAMAAADSAGFDRLQAPALASALEGVMPAVASATRDAALPAAVDWRLTLEADGRVLGTLELGGAALRWHAAGAAPVFATPAPAALAALRDALSSLVGQAR